MNSRKKIFAMLLFMVACAPFGVRAAEQGSDCFHARQMHNVRDRYVACLDLRDTARNKRLAQVQALEHSFCRELQRTLVKESENNETSRQKYQDQHVAILEELLLETPGSGRPSPHPAACP